MQLETLLIRPDRTHLHGASPAQADMTGIRTLFTTMGTTSVLISFDFRSAESITGSYLRATILWTLLSGKEFAEGMAAAASSDPWAIRPLPLYPVVIAKSDEVLGEIDDFLKQRNRACLALKSPESIPFAQALLLGKVDGFLIDTLKLLAERGPSVAQSLKEASNERISIGGWSNRLADLYSHRLVMRMRDGKSWIYQTLSKEHTPWA